MTVTVTIHKVLDGLWATADEFASMTDEEIVELCREDICEILEGARWTVERRPNE